LPCRGVVHVVTRGNLPPRLRALVEESPAHTLDDGVVWRRLRRPSDGAP
jgi:hypothetical protein